jgi:hypothetical protein
METDVGDSHVMPYNIYWLSESWCSEIHFSLKDSKRNFTLFFLYIFVQWEYNSVKGISIDVYYNRGFVKIITVKVILYLGRKCYSIHTSHIYCSISVQFATRNLHIFLPNICKFIYTIETEGRPFLVDINKIMFLSVP